MNVTASALKYEEYDGPSEEDPLTKSVVKRVLVQLCAFLDFLRIIISF